jgi:two-component system, sensor histidine kinase
MNSAILKVMIKESITSFKMIFLFIVMVALLPAYGIIIYSGIDHSKTAEASVKEEAQRQIETMAMAQRTITESVQQILTTLAILPEFKEGRFEEQTLIMQALLQENPDLLNITLTDPEGFVKASALLRTGADLSGRLHIARARESGEFSAGEFIHAKIDQEPAFPWSLPVFAHSGEIIGTITAVYRLSAYRKLFESLELPDNSILGFTDHRGIRIFFHPLKETNPIGLPIKSDVWDIMISDHREANAFVQTGSDGVRRFYAYRELRLSRQSTPYLYMVLGIPEELTLEPAWKILRRNLYMLGIATILALLLGAYFGYVLIGKRFAILVKTVQAIQNGKLNHRTAIQRGPQELLQVAEAVDQMAEALEFRAEEKEQDLRRISAALKVKENLLREVHHRVKNNLQLILSIINLEQENDNFRFQTENRVRTMANVHELLYQTEGMEAIEVEDFLERLTSISSDFSRSAEFIIEACPCTIPLDKAIPFALIVNEILLNAMKYGKNGQGKLQVKIHFSLVGRKASLSVIDSGPGFPAIYSKNKPKTLGMQLITTLASQLNGEVSTRNDNGAVVTLQFPL